VFSWPPVLNKIWNRTYDKNLYQNKSNLVISYLSNALFGYFLGMCDRHANNILLHTNNSMALHIDFDAISEIGFLMPVKEVLPMRLTPNTIAMLDFEGVNGLISDILKLILQQCRLSQNDLLPLIQC